MARAECGNDGHGHGDVAARRAGSNDCAPARFCSSHWRATPATRSTRRPTASRTCSGRAAPEPRAAGLCRRLPGRRGGGRTARGAGGAGGPVARAAPRGCGCGARIRAERHLAVEGRPGRRWRLSCLCRRTTSRSTRRNRRRCCSCRCPAPPRGATAIGRPRCRCWRAACILLHARYGNLPFESLIVPAEQLARFGTPASRALVRDIALVSGPLAGRPEARGVFSANVGAADRRAAAGAARPRRPRCPDPDRRGRRPLYWRLRARIEQTSPMAGGPISAGRSARRAAEVGDADDPAATQRQGGVPAAAGGWRPGGGRGFRDRSRHNPNDVGGAAARPWRSPRAGGQGAWTPIACCTRRSAGSVAAAAAGLHQLRHAGQGRRMRSCAR